MLIMALAPLPVLNASSIKELICLGIASQHTSKIAHLHGVKKYIGPGCNLSHWSSHL